MKERTKAGRYARIASQLEELFEKTDDPVARMATAVAVLHHKMKTFFWTGFYLLRDGSLLVGPYQGSLACMRLAAHTGVCWAGIDRAEAVIVDDVEAFPGHIACDSRSRSEIAVPFRDAAGTIVGVLDVDSDTPGAFNEIDKVGLEAIVAMIYR